MQSPLKSHYAEVCKHDANCAPLDTPRVLSSVLFAEEIFAPSSSMAAAKKVKTSEIRIAALYLCIQKDARASAIRSSCSVGSAASTLFALPQPLIIGRE
jgi:hypothetical protein